MPPFYNKVVDFNVESFNGTLTSHTIPITRVMRNKDAGNTVPSTTVMILLVAASDSIAVAHGDEWKSRQVGGFIVTTTVKICIIFILFTIPWVENTSIDKVKTQTIG